MEFYSFEETFKKLQISEEELRELVVSGEVRCFRDGAEMKFKKADVDALKGMERKKRIQLLQLLSMKILVVRLEVR